MVLSKINDDCLALFFLYHSLSLRTVGSADKLAPSGGTSTMGKFTVVLSVCCRL